MRNLIVICNNDVWMEQLLHSLSSCFDEKKRCKQDFLISDMHNGFLSDKIHISKEQIRNIKPYAKNIFAYCKSEVISIIGDEIDLNFEYDNIIFLTMYIGNALVNKKINEIKIKYKKKFIIPTDDDIDKFYILKKMTKKEVFIIDDFLLDCKNIICPSSLIEYIAMKDNVIIWPYILPIDIELYDDLFKENVMKKFSSLEMHVFTKPRLSKETVNVLKTINRRINNFKTLGLFPYLPFKFNEKLFETIKESLSKINFLIVLFKIVKKRKIGIILFIDKRKRDTYYSQLNTFNSMYIQRRGGFSAIKYAVMGGLLLFGDLETPNAKVLTNDLNLTVLDLDKFDFKKYPQKRIEEIINSNKENMMKAVEKSKRFHKNLFYSQNEQDREYIFK